MPAHVLTSRQRQDRKEKCSAEALKPGEHKRGGVPGSVSSRWAMSANGRPAPPGRLPVCQEMLIWENVAAPVYCKRNNGCPGVFGANTFSPAFRSAVGISGKAALAVRIGPPNTLRRPNFIVAAMLCGSNSADRIRRPF